jgi:hypothetical protein
LPIVAAEAEAEAEAEADAGADADADATSGTEAEAPVTNSASAALIDIPWMFRMPSLLQGSSWRDHRASWRERSALF